METRITRLVTRLFPETQTPACMIRCAGGMGGSLLRGSGGRAVLPRPCVKKRNAGGCRQRRRRRWKFTVTGKTKRNLLRAALVPGVIVLAFRGPGPGRREIAATEEILARADKETDYPRGLLKGRLTHLTPEGELHGDHLQRQHRRKRLSPGLLQQIAGRTAQGVVYPVGGRTYGCYVHAAKLFHKMDRDKYDAVLSTNFSFIDLSNADYQSNYTAAITGTAVIKGREADRLRLDPDTKGAATWSDRPLRRQEGIDTAEDRLPCTTTRQF